MKSRTFAKLFMEKFDDDDDIDESDDGRAKRLKKEKNLAHMKSKTMTSKIQSTCTYV